MQFTFNEGHIQLPSQWQDQSMQVLVSTDNSGINLVITREAVPQGTLTPEDERDRHPDESLLKTTYRYNAAGELTEIILPGDETLTFSRDEAGREVLRHSNRGFACEQGWNAAGQPVSQRAG
ncbi:DcrB-related protein, partial [Escherichia coli]